MNERMNEPRCPLRDGRLAHFYLDGKMAADEELVELDEAPPRPRNLTLALQPGLPEVPGLAALASPIAVEAGTRLALSLALSRSRSLALSLSLSLALSLSLCSHHVPAHHSHHTTHTF